MIKKIVKNSEFNHFNDLSNEWWHPNGQFKILHTLTPLRIKYIKDNLDLSINNSNKKNKKILKDLDILDLGCGGGLVCEPLARLGANITGIDFVNNNIEVAKKHAKISNLNIKYIYQDLNSLNLKNKFDLILLLELIEHINNWKNIVIKIIKNLKPEGRIIFSTINRNILSNLFAIFIAEDILKLIPKNTHQYNKLVKTEELTSFLKKNNMKILDISGLFFNPLFREWTINKKMDQINYFCVAQKIS